MKEYKIKYVNNLPADEKWCDLDFWSAADVALLDCVRPESSSPVPSAKVQLLYTDKGIIGFFEVDDKYVVCRRKNNMDSVWNDSCVEFFVQPENSNGYFNFEFNCIGKLYASYITDNRRTANGFYGFTKFTIEDCDMVKIFTSLKESSDCEIEEAIKWKLFFFVPFSLMEKYTGIFETADGTEWRCNFYKCADESPHPHWVSWSPVKELNFHEPESFGRLYFNKR